MFWIHALCSTRLMKLLAASMPEQSRLNPQEVFLAGLLHNIGFPLLGHQFSDEFAYLNNLIEANPTLNIFNLETLSFGVNHTELGAWLMNAWSMPTSMINVIYHHHNPYYRGENHKLNLLTFLNDYLLGQIGVGDAGNQTCPGEVWEQLSLDESGATQFLDDQQNELEKIIEMSEILAN
jgi:HD-like signal output (HDOD) protein